MTEESYHPWLHRLAWLTAIVALLPISVGAVVTTVDAGMAFADWPTSDGQGMFSYPWLKSTGDHFLEHGHRLAGMLIGFITLVLAVVAFTAKVRPSIRSVVAAIVAGVVLQGLLGGWRVLADERVIAMLHGTFAALVFSLMGVLVALTGRRWLQEPPLSRADSGWMALGFGLTTLVVLMVQYVLGGMLRHLGSAHAWLVHPWFALVVVASSAGLCVALWRTGSRSLRKAGWFVLGLISLQAAIGLVTWGVRYGFPQYGIVAVQQSSLQVAVRSFHKVFGLLTFMATVVAVVRIWHLLPALQAMPEADVRSSLQLGGAA